MHGHAHSLDHRTLSIPSASRTGRTAFGQSSRGRLAAGASHAAFLAEKGRLQHDVDRKVAPGRPTKIRSAEKRLPPFLRLPWRGTRLLRAYGQLSSSLPLRT